MRPRNQAARDQLLATLGRRAAASAAELAAPLGVSVPTLHRLLQEVQPRALTTGKARWPGIGDFWQLAAKDTRISTTFRATCKANGKRLQQIAAQA